MSVCASGCVREFVCIFSSKQWSEEEKQQLRKKNREATWMPIKIFCFKGISTMIYVKLLNASSIKVTSFNLRLFLRQCSVSAFISVCFLTIARGFEGSWVAPSPVLLWLGSAVPLSLQDEKAATTGPPSGGTFSTTATKESLSFQKKHIMKNKSDQ